MFLLQIDQEIFNIMLTKSIHQIARIEFRNANFPHAAGSAPLQPPPGGQPPGTPVLGQQFGPPPFQRLVILLMSLYGRTCLKKR